MNRKLTIKSVDWHEWIFAKGKSSSTDYWDNMDEISATEAGVKKGDIFELLPYESKDNWALLYCHRLNITAYFSRGVVFQHFSPVPVDVNKFWAKFNESPKI